jgi:precorrin-2 dehydrogenase/sirohydrochlorin ferrochelatase
MKYYPVCLDIRDRHCLVVGGGAVASRKVKTLLACGARVTVVSPQASETIQRLQAEGIIDYIQRAYRQSDQNNKFLVFGATDDEELNARISQDAEKHNTLCNIADRPAVCNFILPAIIEQGDLLLAISTSGQSPAMAKRLRRQLADQFGPEYADFLTLMGAIREKLLAQQHAPEEHKPIFNQIIDSPIIDYLKNARFDQVDAVLIEILGEGFDYQTLMGQEPKKQTPL